MPKAVKKEATMYRFDEDVLYPCELSSVEEKRIPYRIKNGPKAGQQSEFVKWEWQFKIVAGESEGLTIYGDTNAEYTNDENDRVRAWAETLLGREMEIGEELDTDLLLGLPCMVTVKHDTPREKRDGTMFYPCPVAEVFPRNGSGVSASAGSASGWGTGQPAF